MKTGGTVRGFSRLIPGAGSGNSFAAPDVPLVPGTNTLTATVTTIDGSRASAAVTVTATGTRPPLALKASPSFGVPPVQVMFRPEAEGIAPTQYRYDFSGDGVVDAVLPFDWPFPITYTSPGIYRATVTATDAAGQQFLAEKVVVVPDRSAVDALLSGRWIALASALQSQDVGAGLVNIQPEGRAKYEDIFTMLRPELPAIFASVSPPELISVEGNLAQYRLRREQTWEGAPRTITCYLWLERDADGIWRISDFRGWGRRCDG